MEGDVMNENTAFGFVDCMDVPRQASNDLTPIVIKKKAIDLEIERSRLFQRRSMVVACHLFRTLLRIGNGLTQGIAVAICVSEAWRTNEAAAAQFLSRKLLHSRPGKHYHQWSSLQLLSI